MAGSILQTLMVFPTLEKHILKLSRMRSFEIYNDATGKLDMVNRILRLRGCFLFYFSWSMLIPLFLKLLNERDVFQRG